ncbi:dynein regulatory complex subunit 2 [Nematolebias whitei]|uniref:dynein regulatory complex subunit 2 n=1 Tax=Nematolebias whitei TaxID=451745 RepID=UPI0018984444|nr:dynein regulatory complex subunit 2 [Nematolebias whitei]
MPKKGRGGGTMSEEKRLLQKQHCELADEEMAKKKKETLMLYLQDKVQKEQSNMAVNLLKLSEGWRKILLQTRDAELRKDLMVLQQTLERQLDELNFIIQKLVRDRQEAELQAAQVQQSHLEQVDFLWTKQEKRLKHVQQHWDSVLQDISSTSNSEKDRMLSDLEKQKIKVQDEQLPVESKETMDEDELLSSGSLSWCLSNQEDMVLDVSTYNMKDRMSQNLQACHLSKHKSKTLDEQISRDKKQMKTKMQNITRLQVRIAQLKQQIVSTKTEKVLMEQDLRTAVHSIRQKCLQLRDQLVRDRGAARKKLVELSDWSGAAAKTLHTVISKGEKVLHVAEICHKLQSRQEVLPGEVEDLQHLLNVALQHRDLLRNQQLDLSWENHQLEVLLRPGDSLDGHHGPLLVSQAPSTSVPPAADRGHNIIEASKSVQHCL